MEAFATYENPFISTGDRYLETSAEMESESEIKNEIEIENGDR